MVPVIPFRVFWQLDWFNIEQTCFDPSFWIPQAHQSKEVNFASKFPAVEDEEVSAVKGNSTEIFYLSYYGNP